MTLSMPGNPPPRLVDAWIRMTNREREAFLPHLVGGTSADWLSTVLTDAGLPCSATTIRTYRRSLNDRAVAE